ncbi:hypothetical protein K439DRAFT_542516 [Ramaria rubella]|nr:hypothetical protein K439DRAFT_542516 [Ramaria rubella]
MKQAYPVCFMRSAVFATPLFGHVGAALHHHPVSGLPRSLRLPQVREIGGSARAYLWYALLPLIAFHFTFLANFVQKSWLRELTGHMYLWLISFIEKVYVSTSL